MGGLKEGYGREILPNGDRYEGYFVKDTMHGPGEMRFSNGAVYRGEFRDGQQSGSGNFKTIVNNSILINYDGEFLNNCFHGKGVLKLDNGDVYEGQFTENMKHGYGTYKSGRGDYY